MSFYGRDRSTVVQASEDEINLQEFLDDDELMKYADKQLRNISSLIDFYVSFAVSPVAAAAGG